MMRKSEAYRFFAKKSFLTYMRGPLANAIPTKRLNIAKVKHMTNLDGITTIVGRRKKHISKKNAATANAMVELMIDLSLERKLKIESHPCGSGSGLPNTKFLAYASVPATLKPFELFSRSLFGTVVGWLSNCSKLAFGLDFWTKSLHFLDIVLL